MYISACVLNSVCHCAAVAEEGLITLDFHYISIYSPEKKKKICCVIHDNVLYNLSPKCNLCQFG